MPQVQRFLVKMPAPSAAATLSLSTTKIQFTARPLFSSIRTSGMGVAGGATWHIVEPLVALDTSNPWDVCHDIVRQGFGLAGVATPAFAEPDFPQQWISQAPEDQALTLTASCESVAQKTGVQGYPGDTEMLWYQNDAHGQFAKASASLQLPADDELVRVAHLDTGYDPEHRSRPARLDLTLQRNFVDANRPNDASDSSSGVFNNHGHGTGTLSILAGSPAFGMPTLGAAPFVKVVPVRVANRVELFYNSAIAQAFDYVHSLCNNPATSVQVVSMSLGGLASQAWADVVNALYDAGVTVVTAAGNNYGNLPTRNIVYPARFNRVIAACGVMADHTPYADLPIKKMAGNYGPASKLRTAVSAYTPNVPWAKFGCGNVVDFDGAGTSAATPQVAAAAAIWLQKHKTACDSYSQKWMRVEGVRKALFGSAAHNSQDKLGNGELKVADALASAPAAQAQLKREEPDSASFGFLKVLTGLGIEAVSTERQSMFELEALQLSQSEAVEKLLPDPAIDPTTLTLGQRIAIAKALAEHPRASRALRQALQFPVSAPVAQPSTELTSIEKLHLRHALAPEPPTPSGRRLRIYAYDPLLARDLETIGINETVTNVRWESNLLPGPIGEYVEVVDVDPASDSCYAPIDLNDPRLLATDGLRPSEANPQFHQQMVYAVSMTTIDFFEKALGRVALWSPQLVSNGAVGRSKKLTEAYVQRLRIYPHALRAENAYYSPERKALLLGYFSSHSVISNSPSEPVFTALSHDIVAHETTHALLDGLHRRFSEATNPDVLAFHEAFADIVALLQHFSMRDSLRQQVAKSRGNLTQETLLAQLAVQFGNATGHYGALRQAIGKLDVNEKTGKRTWKSDPPHPTDYQKFTEPHQRGSVLVAAVFDAFLRIYARRALEPIRLATGGSELLLPGALSTELVDALTEEASKVAGHILIMCIRALDYCPPVDITFGDFLRAVVTADRDLVPNDPIGYRVAFVSAFSAHGIYPENVRNLSTDTIVWEPPPLPFDHLDKLLPDLTLQWDLQTDRRQAWAVARRNAMKVHDWLIDPSMVTDDELTVLGLRRKPDANFMLVNAAGESTKCDLRGLEVHSVRPLKRVGPDGQWLSQLVVELTQSLHASDKSGLVFRGGATLLVDLTKQEASYMVRKRIDQPARVTRQQGLWAQRAEEQGDNYSGLAMSTAEPFAFLHRAAAERRT